MRLQLMVMGLTVFLLCHCQREENQDEEVWEIRELRTELPVASAGKKLGCHGNFVMTALKNGYRIDREKVHSKPADIDAALEKIYKKISARWTPQMIIVARPDTPFQQIRFIIRAAAKAGIAHISFAVKDDANRPNILRRYLTICLPTTGISNAPPVASPQYIRVAHDDSIYRIDGEKKDLLDSGAVLGQLPMLSDLLQTYSAAAEASGLAASIQIHIPPETTYQRAIDVVNCAHAARIRHIFFVDEY